ncbi:hypothetical protein Ais01nite_70350 [Asanoa ishikariensis]|nr:hypothetical protein Ais01nite_70350 [Asanoa ishikariensis]
MPIICLGSSGITCGAPNPNWQAASLPAAERSSIEDSDEEAARSTATGHPRSPGFAVPQLGDQDEVLVPAEDLFHRRELPGQTDWLAYVSGLRRDIETVDRAVPASA